MAWYGTGGWDYYPPIADVLATVRARLVTEAFPALPPATVSRQPLY